MMNIGFYAGWNSHINKLKEDHYQELLIKEQTGKDMSGPVRRSGTPPPVIKPESPQTPKKAKANLWALEIVNVGREGRMISPDGDIWTIYHDDRSGISKVIGSGPVFDAEVMEKLDGMLRKKVKI
jgi:hypothetical protein